MQKMIEHRSQNVLRYLVGGVNSPVRAFRAVGGKPFYVRKAYGSRLVDQTGREYLDYVQSWGALLFGHADPEIVRVIHEAANLGTSFGAATLEEAELAEKIHHFYPSIEKFRLCSSGTEALMSAVRLARGGTGRARIVKFDGCYHGHADSFLVEGGSGLATLGIPASKGVPKETAALTTSLPFNDERPLLQLFKKKGREIACVVVEPVPANMGLVLPRKEFLEELRGVTRRFGTLLIFDEVITGFRIAPGGAQQTYGIQPDLTCLGKILGSGLPIAGFGGGASLMDELAPEGEVYQAGTLSGNPIAVKTALTVLKKIQSENPYSKLAAKTQALSGAIRAWSRDKDYPIQVNSLSSLMTLFFSKPEVKDFETARQCDTKRFARFFHGLLEKGIFIPPSQFECWFLSTAHQSEEVEFTIEMVKSVLEKVFAR